MIITTKTLPAEADTGQRGLDFVGSIETQKVRLDDSSVKTALGHEKRNRASQAPMRAVFFFIEHEIRALVVPRDVSRPFGSASAGGRDVEQEKPTRSKHVVDRAQPSLERLKARRWVGCVIERFTDRSDCDTAGQFHAPQRTGNEGSGTDLGSC